MNPYLDIEVQADIIEGERNALSEIQRIELEREQIRLEMAEAVERGRQRVIAELENEFAVLNICDVWDWFEITLGVKAIELDWAGECNHILKFCENFNLYLYEKPRDNFFEWEGIEKARKMGYKGVVLSNLS